MKSIIYVNQELEELEGVFYYENISAKPYNHYKYDKNWLVVVANSERCAVIEVDALMPEEAVVKAIYTFFTGEELEDE